MRFVVPREREPAYQGYLLQVADIVDNSLSLLWEASERAASVYKADSPGHLAVQLLVHHVIESIDGIAVLVSRGFALYSKKELHVSDSASTVSISPSIADSKPTGSSIWLSQQKLYSLLTSTRTAESRVSAVPYAQQDLSNTRSTVNTRPIA